jgi:hypothetical protein
MPVVIDLDGVSIGGAEPWEAEIYPAVIAKAEIKPSKSSNEDTLYLDLAATRQATDDEGNEVDEERTFRWNTSLQAKALGRFKQLLVRLGVEIPEGQFTFDEADLVGVECRVRLLVEPHYRDPQRQTNRVAEILGTDDDGSQSWG